MTYLIFNKERILTFFRYTLNTKKNIPILCTIGAEYVNKESLRFFTFTYFYAWT